jgi:hypothetical protein
MQKPTKNPLEVISGIIFLIIIGGLATWGLVFAFIVEPRNQKIFSEKEAYIIKRFNELNDSIRLEKLVTSKSDDKESIRIPINSLILFFTHEDIAFSSVDLLNKLYPESKNIIPHNERVVILVNAEFKIRGKYSDGATARQVYWNILIIDTKGYKIITKEKFEGPPPSDLIIENDRIVAGNDDAPPNISEIRAFLNNFIYIQALDN